MPSSRQSTLDHPSFSDVNLIGQRATKVKRRPGPYDLQDCLDDSLPQRRKRRQNSSQPSAQTDPVPLSLRPTSASRGELRGSTDKSYLLAGSGSLATPSDEPASSPGDDLDSLLFRVANPKPSLQQPTVVDSNTDTSALSSLLPSDSFPGIPLFDPLVKSDAHCFNIPAAATFVRPLRHRPTRAQRREKCWTEWKRFLPDLCLAYQTFQGERMSKGSPRQTSTCRHKASCQAPTTLSHSLEIISVDGLREIVFEFCGSCSGIGEASVTNGVFPCTPSQPRTGISIDLLELYSALHLRNTTPVSAFGEALVAFLADRGQFMTQTGAFRESLPDAITWFEATKRAIARNIDSRLRQQMTENNLPVDPAKAPSVAEATQDAISGSLLANTGLSNAEAGLQGEGAASAPVSQVNTQSDTRAETSQESGRSHIAQRPCEAEDPTHKHKAANVPGVASSRLLKLCPLCFGRDKWGGNPRCSPDAILCIDANFRHKLRRRIGQDPPILDNLFILEAEKVQSMEAYVNERRTHPPSSAKGPTNLPETVLDACEESHEACKENKKVGSPDVWSEVGLMALVCRHDRPIFLVRMTGGGEKHYYALALLDALFRLLPSVATVGLLYDISCQLSRGFSKVRVIILTLITVSILVEQWGYLPKYHARMSFATSVFHAYVHQWACQAIFHPRKCLGYGLTNGEGCERLWAFLAAIIALERTLAPNKRLFLLEGRLEHLVEVLDTNTGKWMDSRLEEAEGRLKEAQDWLSQVGKEEATIRAEWRSQRESATSARSYRADHVDAAMKQLLEAQAEAGKFRERVGKIRQVLSNLNRASSEYRAWFAEHETLESQQSQAQERFLDHVRLIGTQVSDSFLARFSGRDHAFVKRLIEVQVLKDVVRKAVTDVQMEAAPLQRVKRKHTQTGKSQGALGVKLATEIHKGIQKRNKARHEAVKLYNLACEKLREIAEPEWHRGIPMPEPLTNDVIDTGVDESIWEDLYFGDPNVQPPAWVTDRQMRLAIIQLLQKDRCEEEIERLQLEANNLGRYFTSAITACLRLWKMSIAANDGYSIALREGILKLMLRRRRAMGKRFRHMSFGLLDDEILSQMDTAAARQWADAQRHLRRGTAKPDVVRTGEIEVEDSGDESIEEEEDADSDIGSQADGEA